MSTIINRRARYDYCIREELEGGLSLLGNEVKSLEDGMCTINGAWCRFISGELYITGINIKPWRTSNAFDIKENRDVKVLLKRRELRWLEGLMSREGVVVVPMQIYKGKSNKYKVLLGIGKGNKNYDKRELIRTREAKIEAERVLKNGSRRCVKGRAV